MQSAVIQTNLDDSNRKFFKSNAAISIYRPQVQPTQWSSSRIKLLNGADSIEAGWMVRIFTKPPYFYKQKLSSAKVILDLINRQVRFGLGHDQKVNPSSRAGSNMGQIFVPKPAIYFNSEKKKLILNHFRDDQFL